MPRALAKWTILGLVLVSTAFALDAMLNRSLQQDFLPEKLQTGWFYTEGICSRFPGKQGAFAFQLKDRNVETIKSEGMDFFKDINDPANQANRPYFHGQWKETPVPTSFFSDGLPTNLHCGPEHSLTWPRGIPEAMKRPGSFYQDHGSARRIFVLPELKLVVGIVSDR